MSIGYIKRLKDGEPTKLALQHEQTLKRLGYTVNVSENGLDLIVEGSDILKDEIDLRDHETAMAFLKTEVIGKKALLSYGGTFKVIKKDESEKVLPGNFALNFIESVCDGLSCLVVKDAPSTPPKASTFQIDDLLAN